MSGMKKWLLAMAVACGALPAAAQAQSPYYWGGWVDGYGQGRIVSYNDNIPYFSAHPPVYYSLDIIRRPMGPSPFAYPGNFAPMAQAEVVVGPAMAAAAPKVAPVMINNSYYVQKNDSAVKNASYVQPLDREAAARGTQLIVNPFVQR